MNALGEQNDIALFHNYWYGPMDEVDGELVPSGFGVLFFEKPDGSTVVIWADKISSSNDLHGQRFEVRKVSESRFRVLKTSTKVSKGVQSELELVGNQVIDSINEKIRHANSNTLFRFIQ